MMLKKIEEDVIRLIKESALLKEEQEMLEKQHRDSEKNLLLDLLEVLDDFDRRFENIDPKLEEADPQTKIWVNYFRSTKELLTNIMEERGVVEIEAIGLKVNPLFHSISKTISDENIQETTIVTELKKGYLWKDELLRKTAVITVKNN